MNDIAIVIQGPSICVDEVKFAWRNFNKDLIFSTWKGEEHKYDEHDLVIFNDIPKYPSNRNFNLQKISTYYGLLEAKKLKYKYVIKVRSDYLPTNDKELIKIIDFNKINTLFWDDVIYLWKTFPTLKGYITDHLIAGPIDEIIDLWDIKDNFSSAQILLTWSYIKKLSNKIDIKYLLPYLNENNDIFYVKFNQKSYNFFGFNNETEFFGKKLEGRYESIFKNIKEYSKTEEETKKYFNYKYLNFLTYYNDLPKISIINNKNIDININDIIYRKNKLEIVENVKDITGDYVINSEDVKTNETIIIEYFKKMNILYDGISQYYNYENNIITWDNPGNFLESGYKNGNENIGISDIFSLDEYLWMKNKNDFINLDFLKIGNKNDILEDLNLTGIYLNPNEDILNNLPNGDNILKIKKIITGEEIINCKIKVFHIPKETIIKENLPISIEYNINGYHPNHLNYKKFVKEDYVELINIKNFIKQYKINEIKFLEINNVEDDLKILYFLINNEILPNKIRLNISYPNLKFKEYIDNILNLFYINYDIHKEELSDKKYIINLRIKSL